MERISKKAYYLNIAKTVAQRSTCLRRNYGAILVKDDQILSTGYNGSARGESNCSDVEFCPREERGAKQGEHYEWCVAIHAEANAIMSAGREARGATLYLYGQDAKTKEKISAEPCMMCQRLIKNAGIASVVCSLAENL